MKTTKICVLGGHPSMHRLVNREGFEFYEIYDDQPYTISVPQWERQYTDFVNNIQPDFVVCINIRLSTEKCNNWIKTINSPNTKFIMWGFDSYRHTKVVHNNADIYFHCLDEDVKRPDDLFLPVYAQPRKVLNLNERKYNIGTVHNRYYHVMYRESEVDKVRHLLDWDKPTDFRDYNDTIGNFKYGLNLSVHYDGLPNFRSFEYASKGVWQFCSRRNQVVLEKLFDYGISYYDRIEDISEIVKEIPDYDPKRIQNIVATKHTLTHRIKEMLTYFDVDLPLIEEDKGEWTYEDYLKRNNKI